MNVIIDMNNIIIIVIINYYYVVLIIIVSLVCGLLNVLFNHVLLLMII